MKQNQDVTSERRENAFIFSLVFMAFVFTASLLLRWAQSGFKIVG